MAAEQNIWHRARRSAREPRRCDRGTRKRAHRGAHGLGNYLASANRLFITGPLQGPQRLSEALQKSMSQHERAVEATRRLRALNRAPRPAKDKDLIGYR